MSDDRDDRDEMGMVTARPKAQAPAWGTAKLPAWFDGMTSEDLDAMEVDGRRYHEARVQRRGDKGQLEEVKVRVCVPTTLEKAKARIDCLEWVREISRAKTRPTWEEACKLLGDDYVDQLDTVCLLARVTRDHDNPDHQHMLPVDLNRHYSRRSLEALLAQVNGVDVLGDPRQVELSEEEFWTVVSAIDRVRNCSPLVSIDGRAQDAFVTSMASRLLKYRMSSSGSPSTETP